MQIHIINGPNLNLLGIRQPEIYGFEKFEDYFRKLESEFGQIDLHYFQSNVEGELINYLHEIGFSANGIIINAGGYTHTSVAIADAISSIESPCIEVHISNPAAREPFRHTSFLSKSVIGSIAGFGFESYRMGLQFLLDKKVI
ncbi:UNVERIFIED_CONTAM: hypothetical protein GTU68_066180 [Idotea baltica]|nr:hypothetical protein [Idotea baltica]